MALNWPLPKPLCLPQSHALCEPLCFLVFPLLCPIPPLDHNLHQPLSVHPVLGILGTKSPGRNGNSFLLTLSRCLSPVTSLWARETRTRAQAGRGCHEKRCLGAEIGDWRSWWLMPGAASHSSFGQGVYIYIYVGKGEQASWERTPGSWIPD